MPAQEKLAEKSYILKVVFRRIRWLERAEYFDQIDMHSQLLTAFGEGSWFVAVTDKKFEAAHGVKQAGRT